MNNNQEQINKLEAKVDILLENHLPHVQAELSKQGADISWLMKFQWLILSTAIASLLVNILR